MCHALACAQRTPSSRLWAKKWRPSVTGLPPTTPFPSALRSRASRGSGSLEERGAPVEARSSEPFPGEEQATHTATPGGRGPSTLCACSMVTARGNPPRRLRVILGVGGVLPRTLEFRALCSRLDPGVCIPGVVFALPPLTLVSLHLAALRVT